MARIPLIVPDQSLNFVAQKWGMGNRIIPIGCALNLASELNYKPVVFWSHDEDIGGASFKDLFESTNLPFELVEGREARIMRQLVFGELCGVSPFLRRRGLRTLLSPQYDKIIELYRTEDQILFRDQVATDLLSFRKIALSTFGFIRYGCDVSWLKPTPSIARRVTELKRQFTPNTVGVHIRGTDVRHRITSSFDRLSIRMRAEIELDPDVNFFIASDGDEDGEKMVSLFKDRLIRIKRSAARETIQGQQDAVVDLFGLASTSRIISWGFSSFARLAAMIGDKPLLRIKQVGVD